MSEFQEMARQLAPVLLSITEASFFVSVCRPPARPGDPPAEAVVEFWLGLGLEDWDAGEDCIAVFVVVPGGAAGDRLPPLLQRADRAGCLRCLVYGSSREGEPFAAMSISVGEPVVELDARAGRGLDAIRSKFGLPPGLPSAYDLEVSNTSGDHPARVGHGPWATSDGLV